jgi:quercetin dioxygenase-like cupin family protein
MRVAPEELQAVHRAGMLTRYALFGPVAFVAVDLPGGDLSGTGLEAPCLADHHGIVLRGSFGVRHADGRAEDFPAGTAFYIPPGPPSHTFTTAPRTVVCGFAPVVEPVDDEASALAAAGFDVVGRPKRLVAPPRSVVLGGDVHPFRRTGAIDVDGSIMGAWLFMAAAFGPRSGYTSGWCDLPHWGIVLEGEVAISYDGTAELASKGDAYYAPPGHRFASADGATIADYTPLDAVGADRVSRWRRAVIDLALSNDHGEPTPPARDAPAGTSDRGVRLRPVDAPG